MPLPVATLPRQRLHLRQVQFEGWKREDGMIDIEGHITDVKDKDAKLHSGLRPMGQPIHDMWIRVTIDLKFNIVDVAATSDAVPYPGGCESIAPAYRELIGLNLIKGFRRAVVERMGTVRGCSHLTELALGLPTAAIQTFAGLVGALDSQSERKPFQLDGCHALETSTETVRRYYPRWYSGAESDAAVSGA